MVVCFFYGGSFALLNLGKLSLEGFYWYILLFFVYLLIILLLLICFQPVCVPIVDALLFANLNV